MNKPVKKDILNKAFIAGKRARLLGKNRIPGQDPFVSEMMNGNHPLTVAFLKESEDIKNDQNHLNRQIINEWSRGWDQK